MAEEGFKRKLTTILSADVVSYSRLMEDNEEATIQTLNVYRNLMANLIAQHSGRVVDMTGDNLMAEFSSVVDAVKCGVETQKEISERNADFPENRQMLFRIGVNLGDIVEEDDRIYGDGVNIAARLEGMAEGGGICISGTVYDQLKNKLELGYQYLGEHSVKNIAAPVRVYKVLMEPEAAGKIIGEKRKTKRWMAVAVAVVILIGLAGWYLYLEQSNRVEPASVEKMAYPLPDKPSIAVLPFTNLSSEKEQEYLCDGLAEGIIDGLAKSDHLFVIARNSSFTYKGKPAKIKQVAEDLGVRYVLEGSIQKAGDRVRITAQLIDALSGHHLFSERYDRELKDFLTLQDEITMKVMTAVQVKLTVGEGAIFSAKGTKNLDAYLKVLQAREYKARTMNKERVAKAIQLCEEAIALDPEYAYAYATLSSAYFDLVFLGVSDSPIESLRRAVELGKKAVTLDESNPFAHACLAFPYMFLKEFDKSISEAEKSISLAPNYATGYFALGTVLATVGRPKEAIPVLEKCLRLSPVPVHSRVLGALAVSYREVGQYEESIETYKKELQIAGPDQLIAHLGLALTYVMMGREKEAQSECAEVMRIDPEFSLERFIKSIPYDQSKKDQIADSLRKAGLK
jgi:adenylate cyclase